MPLICLRSSRSLGALVNSLGLLGPLLAAVLARRFFAGAFCVVD